MTLAMPSIGPPLLRGVGILSAVAIALLAGAIGWLAVTDRLVSWPAAAVAILVCWSAVVGGLLVAALASRSANPVAGVLGGMLIRFGLPLGVGVALTQSGHWLATQGAFTFILVFYLALLPIETWLSLPFAQAAKRQPAKQDG